MECGGKRSATPLWVEVTQGIEPGALCWQGKRRRASLAAAVQSALVPGPAPRWDEGNILLCSTCFGVFQSVLKTMQKRLNTLVKSVVLLSLLAPLAGCVTSRTVEKKARAERARAVI